MEHYGLKEPECDEYLRQYRLWQLIEDSPRPEKPTVAISWYEPTCSPELKWLVGDTRWNPLTTVKYHCIDNDEGSWVALYCRHKRTLNTVHLETIRVISGQWPSALESMHKVLVLKSAHVIGRLLGDDPHQRWCLYPTSPALEDDLACQNNPTPKAVEEYLKDQGECPLRDEVTSPMMW